MLEPTAEQKSRFDQLVQSIEASLGEVNTTKAEAVRVTADAKAAHAEASSTLQASKQVLDQVNSILAQAKTNQQELLGLLEKSKTNSAKTEEIARTADEKDERVTSYEQQLKKLQSDYDATKKKINDLLPGATSAGLAKAFNTRKTSLAPTRWAAFGIFCASILGFIGLGLWAILGEGIKDWSSFVLFTIERSPIILGLIVLEEFSRRLFNSTLRLEEDYAYKETLSMAFDGYQKAMSQVEVGAKDTLSHTLSKNVLDALKERPGRLLEQPDKDGDQFPLQALLSQENAPSETNPIGLITKLYDDLKSNLKGSIFRIAIIIAVAVAVGFAIGRFSPEIISDSRTTEKSTSTSNILPASVQQGDTSNNH